MCRRIWLTLGLVAVTWLIAAHAKQAAAQTNAVASGDWSNPGTWSAGEPSGTLHAQIDGGRTVTVTQGGELASLVDVGTAAGESGTLAFSDGDLTILDEDPADPNLPSIRIAAAAESTGTLNMNGGSVFISGGAGTGFAIGDLIVGDNGNGQMTQTGGTMIAEDEIIIGLQPTSNSTVDVSGGTLHAQGRSILASFAGTGTINVSGTAEVIANFDLLVGFLPGSTGNFNQSGGTVTANFMFSNISGDGPSTANLNMTGGTFNANIAFVMGQRVGTSTMNHSGGTINATANNGDFVVADGDGNTSVYNISGTAEVNLLHSFLVAVFDDPVDPAGRPASNGTVNQTGGVITAGVGLAEGRDGLIVGRDGVGVWNLSGGTINSGNVFLGDFDTSNGTMNVSGGVLNVAGNLNVGGALASNAAPDRVAPDGSNGAQGQALDANGTLNVQGTGGDINVTGNLLANPDDKSPARNAAGQENDSLLKFTLGSTGISPIDVGLKADLDGAVIDVDDPAGYFTANPSATLTLISAAGGFGNVFNLTPAEQLVGPAGAGKNFTFAAGDETAFNFAIVPRTGGGEMLVVSKGAGGLPGDFDNNGDVDGADLLAIQRGLGSTASQTDVNNWKANFGAGVGSVGAVPEPNALVLSLGAALGGMLLRRRRFA